MGWRAITIVAVAAVFQFLIFSHLAPIPDVAWLIEGARRWVGGAQLYSEVREVNPPLVFYEMVLLTGGVLTPKAYVAGVSIIMVVSTILIGRSRGQYLALASLAAMMLGGLTNFGQRDHLALIYSMPFVVGGSGRKERIATGFWAFLGVGLKPHFLLIVAAPALVRWWRSRELLTAENVTLGVCCCFYLVAVIVIHPIYFTEMIPLGSFVYGAYGMSRPDALILGQSFFIVIVCALAKDRALAAAAIAALFVYFLQGKFWPYHFVPAAGFTLLLCLSERGRAFRIFATLLAATQLLRGPEGRSPTVLVPEGQTATFLTAHVWGAYPTSLLCGVKNASRYPAIWTIPGAWNIFTDPHRPRADRDRARQILVHERQLIRDDILTMKPSVIYADARDRKPYFERPFNYMKFIGPLPEYRLVGTKAIYEVWAREPLSPRECTEKL